MRIRFLSLAGATVLALALAGCSSLRTGGASANVATIAFANESTAQADVYAVAGSEAVRLGTVLAGRTERLRVPSDLVARGGPLTIRADLLARGDRPSTGPLTLREGDVINVRLASGGTTLIVTPR